jgi:hypothetical protein
MGKFNKLGNAGNRELIVGSDNHGPESLSFRSKFVVLDVR